MKKTCMLSALLIGCGLCSTAQNPKDFRPMEDVNHVTDLTLDSLEKANTARPVPGSSRKGNRPVLFLVGNSTMRTGTKGNGDNGQWGWGYFAHEYFDADKLTVENHALGGTSSRTFDRKLWPDVKKGIRTGTQRQWSFRQWPRTGFHTRHQPHGLAPCDHQGDGRGGNRL